MFDGLRKKLEELVADVNPFDNGASGATVRAARNKPAPAQTISANRQPQRQAGSQLGAAQSRPLTLQQPKPQTLAPSLPKMPKPVMPQQDNNPLKIAGQAVNEYIVKPVAESVNTMGKAYASGINYGIDQLNGTNRNRQTEILENMKRGFVAQNKANAPGPLDPDYRAKMQSIARGSQNIANTLRQQQTQQLQGIRKNNDPLKVGAAGVNLATTVVSPGMSTLAKNITTKTAPRVGNFAGKVIGNAAAQAPIGAVLGATGQLQQSGAQTNVSDLIKSAGMGAVGGAVLGGAVPIVGAAGKKIVDARKTASQNLISSGMSPRMALQGGFVKIPNSNFLDNTTDRPGANYQKAIEDALNSGDDFRAQKIVNSMPDGDLKAGMQSTLNALNPPTIARNPAGSVPPAGIPRQSLPRLVPRSTLTPQQPTILPRYEPTLQDTSAMPSTADKILPRRIPSGQEIASNIQNPSPEGMSELPTFNTKKVSLLDKATRSTRSIIERQGESGKKLASGLQTARDTQELYLGDLQKQMPTVTELARKGRNALINKDFENFVDAAQGLASPKNDKIAKAVQEWKLAHPGIRERAVKAGLDVGDLGPDYYPHFIDYDKVFKDKNTYNDAINHLVKSGQASTSEDAIQLLSRARDVSRNREFGNLEASRVVDLPFYDKTPNSFTDYLSGSAKRIANTETFGKKDQKALELIKKIGLEGGDTEAAKNAYDIAVGAKNYGETAESVSRGIRKYITTTRLGLGALTNTSQSVNTGIVTGHFRTMGAMLKQLNPKTREFVADTGVISDALLNDLRTQKGVESFSSKVLGKMINKVTAPGFGTVEKFNRSVAATAGRDYALRLAQKGDEGTLRKLGVTGPISGKTLTDAQQVQAARKIVEKTQFKVDPQDLPGWVDSPGGKLVAQFRTFSYNQGKFFSNEVLKPAAKGNLMPLARVLAALPVGYGLYEARRTIDGRPEEEDQTKVGLQSFSKIGGAGLALDIYQSLNPVGSKYLPMDRRTSMATGAIGGPAVGQATQLAGGLSEAIQQKNIPKDESRLDGKVAVKSADGDKYTDLTPLSRFGMQQVPVIGTATANRVLPYKKESEADSGKPSESIANAKASIKEKKEEREKAFRNSLSDDDYTIAQMSKSEQKQLIKDGLVTKEKIDGLNKYVKAKKKELGYGGSTGSYSDDLPDSINSVARKVLEDADSADRSDEWKKTPTSNKEVKKWLEQLMPNKTEIPEVTNETALKWAEFKKDQAAGKIGKLDAMDKKKSLLRETFNSQLSDDERDLYKLSKPRLQQAIDERLVSDDNIQKALKVEKQMYDAGIISETGLAKKLGLESFGGKSGGRGGGKGGRKKGSFDYKLFGFSPSGQSNSKQLHDMLKNAKLKTKASKLKIA